MSRKDPCQLDTGTATGERVVARVMGHVVGCDPCDGALDQTSLQGDTLRYLAGGESVVSAASKGVSGGSATLVREVLGEAAEAGKSQLGDLVYEMAKACLAMDEGFAERVIPDVPARSPSRVRDEYLTVRDRAGYTTTELPDSQPRSFLVGEKCLVILKAVEGETPRQVLALGALFNQMGRLQESERIYQELATRPLEDRERLFAMQGMLRCYLLGDRFDLAARVARDGLALWSEDVLLNTGAAIANACVGDRALVDNSIASIRQVATTLDTAQLAVVEHTARRVAFRLGRDEDVVASEMGLKRGSGGAS